MFQNLHQKAPNAGELKIPTPETLHHHSRAILHSPIHFSLFKSCELNFPKFLTFRWNRLC
uniref:Uncharacterized protein n=1 Tax=Medicago truncatula TaxID=3880 RepID=I3S5B7_MEDTR|nr:unknown [Medicago truncatula]